MTRLQYSTLLSYPRVYSTTTNETNVVERMKELRARTPYALFVRDQYSSFSGKHPELKLGQLSKKIAEAWKNLEETKKKTYVKQYEDQRTKYNEEKNRLSVDDLKAIDNEDKARRIASRVRKTIEKMPLKRPRTVYSIYLSSLDRGEADMKTFMAGAKQRWTQMTVQDKQKFEEMHREEQRKYQEDLVAWAQSNEKIVKPRRTKLEATPKQKKKLAKPSEDNVRKRSSSSKSKTGKVKRDDGNSSSSDEEKKKISSS